MWQKHWFWSTIIMKNETWLPSLKKPPQRTVRGRSAARRPPHPHAQVAVQPPSKSRFLFPLRGRRRGGLFPHRSPLRQNFEKKKKQSGAHFLQVLRGSATSLLRSRKGLLIAQEEGSLIWRPQWCSSLQPHGALISTCAIDRKRLKKRRRRARLCCLLWCLHCDSTVSYIIFIICCCLDSGSIIVGRLSVRTAECCLYSADKHSVSHSQPTQTLLSRLWMFISPPHVFKVYTKKEADKRSSDGDVTSDER